jgi:molybdopterin-containing oxidoreductase family iron-sulfur binding subunit
MGTFDLTELRARMRGTGGKQYWRSLEALADTPDFQAYLHREFPENATEWLDPVGRRSFLKLMSASLALAGVGAACTVQPTELIVPYVRQPEETIPGKPLYFATAMTLGGVATGLLIESHEGRPTKAEGNPDHPGSLGATDLYAQGTLLTLYDPDRSQSILQFGEIRPWSAFITAVRAALSAQAATRGAGLRILTETVASPSLAAQIQQMLTLHPAAKWIQWEPTAPLDNAREGARLALGQYLQPVYDFTRADVILSLDGDFLAAEGAANLRYARQFGSRRRLDAAPDRLNRLYVVETAPSVTGMNADHRVPLKGSHIDGFARAIASRIGAGAAGAPVPAGTEAFVDAIAQDLSARKGTSLVLAGEAQPPAVHALVHAMNQALGNVGSTITYLPPPEIVPSNQHAAFRELVSDMNAGRVQTLLIIGESNPVQTAPADFAFADALAKVQTRIHSGLFLDETATLCHWHVPAAHFLEAWSDARTVDGTVSIVQPLIAPMYGGKSAHEIVQTLLERPERNGYDIVREYWTTRAGGAGQAGGASGGGAPSAAAIATGASPAAADTGTPRAPMQPGTASPTVAPPTRSGQAGRGATGTQPAEQNVAAVSAQAAAAAAPPMTPEQRAAAAFERTWRRWLHDGYIAGSAFGPSSSPPASPAQPAPPASAGPIAGIEVNFRRDPTIYDGRFANNGWLQELPKPVTKLTWDNAALMSPATGQRLEVENGDIVEVTHDGRRLRVPVWINPGHAADAVTIHLGYGRTRAGRVGNATGVDAYVLRGSAAPWFGAAEIRATGDHSTLVSTQDHWTLEGRNILRAAPLEAFKATPTFAREMEHLKLDRPISLYPAHEYTGTQWGMVIDLNTCTGCMSCVIACQAENNIPVVGKEQVGRNREMHWLRVDRYYTGPLDNPDTFLQPLPCMHCENAPCEVVCPVAATVHSDEGLNDMVYNRCVGTRYCSNNCPYKVRRFNFLLYQDWDTPSFKLQRNPDVTVRSRGVMEKCTYCVQRINSARIQAKREDREIRDGEVLTACQASCPTQSIVFGNINDPQSQVARLKQSARNYGMLDELNTRPRTTYLAAVRNPHPSLPTHVSVGGHARDHESDASEQH